MYCIFKKIRALKIEVRVVAHNMLPDSYIRLRDNEIVSRTQELTLDNTDPLDDGDYQCTVTNIAGSTTAMITLNGKL